MEKVFHYNESKINVVKCNDDIWFKGRDIANALGYENPLKAIRMHVDPDDKMPIDELLTVSKGVTNPFLDWDKNLSLLCEAVDQYALQWTKWEMVELSVLSSWKEMVKGQIEERISKLKQNFKQSTGKVLQNADVKACLSDLHNKYVFVPADKAPNNIIIICKRYYIETLIKELG